jgi:hypothetical protein
MAAPHSGDGGREAINEVSFEPCTFTVKGVRGKVSFVSQNDKYASVMLHLRGICHEE